MMSQGRARGLILAAPSSHSGKTLVGSLLARGFIDRGIAVRLLKTGPDYLDPIFHRAATGRECENIDLWAMGRATVDDILDHATRSTDSAGSPSTRSTDSAGSPSTRSTDSAGSPSTHSTDSTGSPLILCEAVMGLFDGSRSYGASGADVAAYTGWPVVLVMDAAGSGESIAAVIRGFSDYRADVPIAGVIFNRISSPSHARLLRRAAAEAKTACLGMIPRLSDMAWPSRHLGLAMPESMTDSNRSAKDGGAPIDRLDRRLEKAKPHYDLDFDACLAAARAPLGSGRDGGPIKPPRMAKSIAVARDFDACLAAPRPSLGSGRDGGPIKPPRMAKSIAVARDFDACLAAPRPSLGSGRDGGSIKPPRMAKSIAVARDFDACLAAPRAPLGSGRDGGSIKPPWMAKSIAVARDKAFSFIYPHHIRHWRSSGADIAFFSPLDNESPPDADAIFLPGGYPELYAERLAGCGRFLTGLRQAAGKGTPIYGECGGFMVLGETLTDFRGDGHPMAGLLPIHSRIKDRLAALGYRQVRLVADGFLGPAGSTWRGHEFHYSVQTASDRAAALFVDAEKKDHYYGVCCGSVIGSYIHLIDRVCDCDRAR